MSQKTCDPNNRIPISRFQPILWLAILLLAACRPAPAPQPTATLPQDLIETIVAATLSALQPQPSNTPPWTATPTPPESLPSATPTQTSPPTVTLEPEKPLVSGRICFRTANIPAMTAYFEDIKSKQAVEMPIEAGQTRYEVVLPPGTYIAYAWLNDFSLGGLYSKAVPCGLGSNCKDHQPIEFDVALGDRLKGIDLCDWYAFSVPEPPGKPQTTLRGSLNGQISYPGGAPPVLHVVAFNQFSGYWYVTFTNNGASVFTISNLPPGEYKVVAFTADGKSGGYADSSHNLIPVTVKAGETATGIEINDWNAPSGTFPSDPSTW